MQEALTTHLDFSPLSEGEIRALLKHHQLSLTPEEALRIQNELLKRPPTLSECVLWSIQGSEHCSYKSTRQHLKQFNTASSEVILGPSEDSGIVSIAKDKNGHRYGLVVSHESHNHPSQVVPYEGAATGVGGNVRDVSCMGAEVIAVADGLRFGNVNAPHTAHLLNGVVSGIAGYANPIGVPNLAGDLDFDEDYNDNCLVTVVGLGIVREDRIIHSYAPKQAEDHRLILVGKPTDNSGFGGAAFASLELDESEKDRNKGAVQEPNAFLQCHLLKANQALFQELADRNELHRVAFKDLGAGGVACASVEIAESGGYGAEVQLQDVPVSMTNLLPHVVLCAETQERFLWAVPPDLVELVLSHYNRRFALPDVSFGARAAVIGKLRSDGLYIVRYGDAELVHAKARWVTQGLSYDRPYQFSEPRPHENIQLPSFSVETILKKLVQHPSFCSRLPVYERYDKQVQGRVQLERGRGEAGVLAPFLSDRFPEEIQNTGVSLALGQNPRFCKISAYDGAMHAVLEAVRKITAVGARPVAVTDCLCFGNPENEFQMGELVQAISGIRDACAAIFVNEEKTETLPIVSGNVSLYNATSERSIPPSPMMSCIGVLENVHASIPDSFQETHSSLVLIRKDDPELGGSLLYALHDVLGTALPKIDLTALDEELRTVREWIASGSVSSCSVVDRGGVMGALLKMSMKSTIGCELMSVYDDLTQWFSEAGGFVLEVPSTKWDFFREKMKNRNVPHRVIGKTIHSFRFKLGACEVELDSLKTLWVQRLRQIEQGMKS